jgi:hypothetical protein
MQGLVFPIHRRTLNTGKGRGVTSHKFAGFLICPSLLNIHFRANNYHLHGSPAHKAHNKVTSN